MVVTPTGQTRLRAECGPRAANSRGVTSGTPPGASAKAGGGIPRWNAGAGCTPTGKNDHGGGGGLPGDQGGTGGVRPAGSGPPGGRRIRPGSSSRVGETAAASGARKMRGGGAGGVGWFGDTCPGGGSERSRGRSSGTEPKTGFSPLLPGTRAESARRGLWLDGRLDA